MYKLTDPNKDQAGALDGHGGYILEFHGVLDFKVEEELPFSQEIARQSAVFFTPEKDGYQRCQAAMIDQAGIASFYLAQVDAGRNISPASMSSRRRSRGIKILSERQSSLTL